MLSRKNWKLLEQKSKSSNDWTYSAAIRFPEQINNLYPVFHGVRVVFRNNAVLGEFISLYRVFLCICAKSDYSPFIVF